MFDGTPVSSSKYDQTCDVVGDVTEDTLFVRKFLHNC